ncbi:hypothetical protein MUP79_09775, partial [Candidatus Bathyarchaeota archaeon]|nr:hypothetical protein [Candidatus Bathyarchaeota archaeon]
VIVSLGGVVGQPSLTDPNKADIVNDAGVIKHVQSNQKTNHVTGDITIDQLLGGKSWDHGRYLMPALGITATAVARVAPGFTYELAGVPTDTVGIVTSPVVSLASLKWYQPPTPPPPPPEIIQGEEPPPPPDIVVPPPPPPPPVFPPPPPPDPGTQAFVVEQASTSVSEGAMREAMARSGPSVTFEKPLPAGKKTYEKFTGKIGGTGATYIWQLAGTPSLIQIWGEVGSNLQLGSSGRLPMLLVSIALMVVAGVWVLSDRNAKKRFKYLSGWFSNI